MPLLLGFLLPAGLLLRMAVTDGDAHFGARFVTLTLNSFTLAGVTAIARGRARADNGVRNAAAAADL